MEENYLLEKIFNMNETSLFPVGKGCLQEFFIRKEDKSMPVFKAFNDSKQFFLEAVLQATIKSLHDLAQ